MSATSMDDNKDSAWNTEIRSTLPQRYLPLSTMFRPENVFTSIETANELSGFTGLPIQQLICFRPQRLVVHELLIRVSADIFVSDGSKYEDLGVNFRRVVARILNGYIEPHMAQIIDRFERLREDSETMIAAQLDADLYTASKKTEQPKAGFSLARLFRAKPARPAPGVAETPEQVHQRILDSWRQKAVSSADALPGAVFGALAQVANALIIKHGRIIGDKALLTALSSGLLCNQYGSEVIGEMIAPYILQAAEQEGYRLLPAQSEPVVINVKGASASGKSTMRPAQKKHVEKLGLNWQDARLRLAGRSQQVRRHPRW